MLLHIYGKFTMEYSISFLTTQIEKYIYVIVDNISVHFGELVFQQTIGILTGTNCAPLLAYFFLHAYEADFNQGLL